MKAKLTKRKTVNTKMPSRKKTGRRLPLIFFAAAVLMLCLAACGDDTDTSTGGERPVIVVGSSDYPPFIDMDNNGNPTGLDLDILKEAFDRVGYDLEFVSISWEDKDDLLASGEIDCVTGGFTVNGREGDYLWVGPYMSSNQVVVVNNTGDIDSLADLGGKTVAVQSAGTAESILLEHSNSDVPADVQVFSYEDNMLPFAALGCDYIDAFVADEPVVLQYMQDYDTAFTILDEALMYAEVGTAFYKKGNAVLCSQVNAAIDEMREDGTLEKIIESYLGETGSNPGGDELEE